MDVIGNASLLAGIQSIHICDGGHVHVVCTARLVRASVGSERGCIGLVEWEWMTLEVEVEMDDEINVSMLMTLVIEFVTRTRTRPVRRRLLVRLGELEECIAICSWIWLRPQDASHDDDDECSFVTV